MDKAFSLTPDALEALLHTARTSPDGEAAPETPAPKPEPAGPADSAHTPAAILLTLLEACRGESGRNAQSEALLLALRPHLRPERRVQVERIAELIRLARAVYTGYQTMSGGEKDA
jgi:hypothetical protein